MEDHKEVIEQTLDVDHRDEKEASVKKREPLTFFQLCELVDGKVNKDVKPVKPGVALTDEDLAKFKEYLSIDPDAIVALKMTDNYKVFFASRQLLNLVIDDDKKEELFYAAVNGQYYKGIPGKLIYTLRKAISEYGDPMRVIEALPVSFITKYSKPGVMPEGITIKKVMEELFGVQFKMVSDAMRAVSFKDWYEIYVPNTDRIALVPNDIAERIKSREDIKQVRYVPDVGICFNDEPLRIFNGRLGITVDEYDLRECR